MGERKGKAEELKVEVVEKKGTRFTPFKVAEREGSKRRKLLGNS